MKIKFGYPIQGGLMSEGLCAATALAALLLLAVSCSEEDSPTLPAEEATSISIDPNPNSINAPWTLTGPSSYSHAATGDVLLEDLHPGSYSILWGLVAGWIAPGTETKTLAAGGSISFNGTYTDLIQIPAGDFFMGAPANELGAQSYEQPQHTVTLTHGFYLQSTEVTNQQYLKMAQWAYDHAYVTATTSSLRDNLDGSTRELLDLDGSYCEIAFSNGTFSLRDAGHGINPDHPVKDVTWYGAVAYCDWLSVQAGLPRAYNHSTWLCNAHSPYTAAGYRLPTEAEWEYACRAGSTTAFANGPITYTECSPVDPVLSQIGWYCGNDLGWTSVVGQKIPNAWGLYDMHGNLEEWCNDLYSSFGSGPISNPVGPTSGSIRVARGGYWIMYARGCRSASRRSYETVSSNNSIGFRPARSAY